VAAGALRSHFFSFGGSEIRSDRMLRGVGTVMFDVLRSDLEGVEHLSGALGVDDEEPRALRT